MLANKNKSMNFNAVSKIGPEIAMYMTCSYNSETDEMNFNQSIRNKELYLASKEEVDKDVEEWKNEVMEEIG